MNLNQPYKFTRNVVNLWRRTLDAVPDAIMTLKQDDKEAFVHPSNGKCLTRQQNLAKALSPHRVVRKRF
jgi:predicted O-linked N-acetylglucosamine transferase (SPINDLY family)